MKNDVGWELKIRRKWVKHLLSVKYYLDNLFFSHLIQTAINDNHKRHYFHSRHDKIEVEWNNSVLPDWHF